ENDEVPQEPSTPSAAAPPAEASTEASTGASNEAPTGASTEAATEPPVDPIAQPQATTEPPVDPIAQLKAELEATKDRYLRTAADFDNYRKRARRDVDEAEKKGKETLLRELLPVFDNLERAAASASQSPAQTPEARAIAEGVRMVLKQFFDTLERVHIRRIPSTGTAFDPNLHEAIQQIETADQPPGTVVAEVQAGYQMGDRLIRAAMVVVAKAPAPKTESN
ncbi:MAG: nucleotide exchange factor GrpE, partial [Polyangiaceae bacterium]|nr:nucleotide exchange factor GrpE [Polyangiaceae bacterium]